MISSLMGIMVTAAALRARRFSTSSRICNLPVRNIRVLGDWCRIRFSESSSLVRYSGTHSSNASMHMKVGRLDEISCNISTISPSPSFRPPTTFPWSRKAWTIFSGMLSSSQTTCFRRELRMLVGDCSLWAAKSK